MTDKWKVYTTVGSQGEGWNLIQDIRFNVPCAGNYKFMLEEPAHKVDVTMTPEYLQRDPTAEYVGDGVYVRHDGYQMWIHTSNGEWVSPGIALEAGAFKNLTDYAKRRGLA